VFENRVLRKICRPQTEKPIGNWRKLHSEELYDLNFSSNTVWVIKLREMKWVGM
jgi:hypothetical protein